MLYQNKNPATLALRISSLSPLLAYTTARMQLTMDASGVILTTSVAVIRLVMPKPRIEASRFTAASMRN